MKVSAFDRFLISLAPRWGIDRVRARAAVESFVRHYDAASPGRRTDNWPRQFGDVDAIMRGAMLQLRLHARDLIRNNGWARRGQRIIANNTVGPVGILPKAISDQPELAKQAIKLWKSWAQSTECESEERHTFGGIQHLAMKHLYSDGEVLIRRRWRRPKDNLTLPMQLQVLEADYLDQAMNQLSESKAGGPIVQGVEFDKIGKRAAYWLFDKHPGSGRNVSPSKRIPAEEIAHVNYTERSSQTRGVSWLGSGIVNIKDLDEYEDAELMKQKIAACFAAFITDMEGAGTAIGEEDQTNPLTDTLEPGMMLQLPPGKTVATASPPGITSDQLPTRTLRKIAAGLGVPYEELTGDYSNVNFSSARMARLAHWGNVQDWQQNMLIPLLCNRVWAWAMEAAELAGEMPPDSGVTADWTPPPMPMIEPDKEGLGLQRMVRSGAKTPSEMVREQGFDPDEHWEAYAADLKKLDELGIVLDSDARKTSAAGLEQPSETTLNAPPPPKPAPPPKAGRDGTDGRDGTNGLDGNNEIRAVLVKDT